MVNNTYVSTVNSKGCKCQYKGLVIGPDPVCNISLCGSLPALSFLIQANKLGLNIVYQRNS